MKNQLLQTLIFFFTIIYSASLFSQRGVVTGVLNSDNDGLPLPGVTIVIKGTTYGTQTDFDGNYSIECEVGDKLVFQYVGMKTSEVLVTRQMFSSISNNFSVEQIPVEIIQSEAYSEAVKKSKTNVLFVPSIESSERTYNKNNHFEYKRIKSMSVKLNQVNINYFSPDVHYEVGYNAATSLQFIKKSKLPKLQSIYSQGAVQNDELSVLGPETGNPFSYGPKLAALEFDGSIYAYDTNGQLVNLGNGNGTRSNSYDNSILQNAIKTTNNLFFNVSTNNVLIGFDINHKTNQDFFGREQSTSNDIMLKFKNTSHSEKRLQWDAFVKYASQNDNQPTMNGFHNNMLFNSWVTPFSFDNRQGTVLEDGSQRSFNPNQFNNPNWLLDTNRNSENNNLFVASLQNEIGVSAISLESNMNYTFFNTEQIFGLVAQTNGFENGYLSRKYIAKNQFNSRFNFNYETNESDYNIEINSVLNYTFDDLSYDFNEATGFNAFSFSTPQNSASIKKNLHRNTLRFFNEFSFRWNDIDSEISFSNNCYISSIQENKWFLPKFQLQLDLEDIFNIYGLNNFLLTTTTSFDVNDMSLMYSNQSHNSLGLLPSQSLSYTANNDLFLNSSLQLEEKQNYDISTSIGFRAFETNLHFGATYFNSKSKGSIFPVIDGNSFSLQNSADVRNKGVELNLDAVINISSDVRIFPKLVFSKNRMKVLKLFTDEDLLAIAGFSSVSKNLIVGQPAGVIVGSAYARDGQNNVLIGEDGFPLVSAQQQIIGDPTPDFTLGFSNEFTWKRLKVNFTIDIQKGGDVWNGTQNVLNFFGTSQQSADQRTLTNFVFKGVNPQGNPNTVLVDFYNPTNGIEANRFIRYGFEGVAEDAIEDGSYINLQSIDIIYSFIDRYQSGFFRQMDVGVYANNLFTSTKFDGASPYGSLYNTSSGQGLNFFNAPLATEIGFTITLKI